MKRILLITPVLLLLGVLTSPDLLAQGGRGRGSGRGQHDRLRMRDGSCTTPGQGRDQRRGQGVRKQDGTGPRAGTPDCPKTPKAANPSKTPKAPAS